MQLKIMKRHADKKWFSFETKAEQKEVIKMINNSRTDMEAAMSLNEKFPHLSLSSLLEVIQTTLVMKLIKIITMKLNRPGIYHIYTDSFELLANVVGEAPVLRIPRALVMNDVIQRGQFRVVEEDSYEIQTVLHNPDLCIFKV